jgi:hypothetical protein
MLELKRKNHLLVLKKLSSRRFLEQNKFLKCFHNAHDLA